MLTRRFGVEQGTFWSVDGCCTIWALNCTSLSYSFLLQLLKTDDRTRYRSYFLFNKTYETTNLHPVTVRVYADVYINVLILSQESWTSDWWKAEDQLKRQPLNDQRWRGSIPWTEVKTLKDTISSTQNTAAWVIVLQCLSSLSNLFWCWKKIQPMWSFPDPLEVSHCLWLKCFWSWVTCITL